MSHDSVNTAEEVIDTVVEELEMADPRIRRVDELEGYLTLNEAARILGVTDSALRHAIRRGRLEAVRIGDKRLLVSPVALVRYVDGRPRWAFSEVKERVPAEWRKLAEAAEAEEPGPG